MHDGYPLWIFILMHPWVTRARTALFTRARARHGTWQIAHEMGPERTKLHFND